LEQSGFLTQSNFMPTSVIDDLLQQGRRSLSENNWDAADAAFTRGIDAEPTCAAAFLGRGLAHIGRRDWGPACDDFDAAERLGLVNEPEIYRGRAKASYFSSFDHEDRLADADRLIELAPDDPDGWFYRGDALSDMGEYESAITALTRAIELNPNHADAYFQRGMAWTGLDDEDQASRDLRASTRIGSLDPNVYHRKGHFFEGQADYPQARLEFLKAIELEPNEARHYSCAGGIMTVLEAEGTITAAELEAHFVKLERITNGSETAMNNAQNRHLIYETVQDHFGRVPLQDLELTERSFPPRTLPDLQCAFDDLPDEFTVTQFWATAYGNQPVQQFATLYNLDRRTPVRPSNPRYGEYDIGQTEPFRCLKDGVWLLRLGECNLLALLDTTSNCLVVRVELAAPRTEQGKAATEQFFKALEDSIKRSRCYRGKVLSMTVQDNYSGTAPGLMVHRINPLHRDQVILPLPTLSLLDRNVLNFVQRRDKLLRLGMSTKKGLLFYGPPGVGKTHTVHYLATNLPDHTTLLITGEQVGNLSEYMTLARLYAPSIVVVEDVDLIARHREDMRGGVEEMMLNKLLNEMDGIQTDAAIIFILTTNRASALEEALASRPGRIDQAIEFPLPDATSRAKLVQLYSCGVRVDEGVVRYIVGKTDNVSASFIKELMRRCVQFALDRDELTENVVNSDVDSALEELLVSGGSLNKKLLGFGGNRAGFATP
jgi:cell division protease FtsH